MRKSQQIAQEILNTVARSKAGSSLSTREVLALSEEYNRLIDQVNKRMQEAVVLLHQGHRSEALQNAESTPPVLEEAAILDLHGTHDWADICQLHDLPRPSHIDLSRASELNNAYFVELRLTPLLVRNRRLALSRAPTEIRIQVLKHLAEADHANPIWAQDLRIFERTRMREIERDLPTIIRLKNLSQAEKLRQELSGKWLEPVPDHIRRQVEDLYQGLRAGDAMSALPQLQEMVEKAQAAGDVAGVRKYLELWQERALAAQNPAVPPAIATAQAWLAEADRLAGEQRLFTQATMELQAALDRPGSSSQLRTQIERAWSNAQKFDKPLPPVLIARYQSRKAEIQLDSRRRFVLIALATVCIIVVLAGGVAFTIHHVQQSVQASTWRQILDKTVAEDRLSEVEPLIDQVQREFPQAQSHPELAQAMARAQTAVNQDAARAERLNLAMTTLEQAGPASFDQATFENVQNLVKRDGERVRFERFLAQVNASRQKDIQSRDAQFKDALEALSDRFIKARDDAGLSPLDKSLAIQAIVDDIRKLTARTDVSPNFRAAGEILLSKVSVVLQGIKDSVDQTRKRTDTLDRLRLLMDSPAEYTRALNQFTQDNASSPLNEDFTKAAALGTAWSSARFWANNLPALPPVSDVDATQAARKKIQDALKAETVETFRNQLTMIDSYLGKQAQFSARRPWEDKLKRALDTGFVSGVWMIQPKSVAGIPGPRYYVLPTVKPAAAKDAQGKDIYEFPYVQTPAQAAGSEAPGGQASVPADLYQSPVKSPQIIFAEETRPLLSERNALSQWESYHLQFLQAAQKQTGKMDVALQVNLAQLIVPDAIVYDLVADTRSLDEIKKGYTGLAVDTSWINPMDERAAAMRARIQEQASPQTWPDFKALVASAQNAGRDLRALASRTTARRPVAILFPQENGKLGIAGQIKPPSADLTLEAIFLNPQGQPDIRTLGLCKAGGALELQPGALDLLPAGTLIYASPAQVPPVKP